MIDFGHGISLSTIEEKDLINLWNWRNSPIIYKWCRQPDLLSMGNHKAWFEKQRTDPTMAMYLINKEGEGVGVCGLTSINFLHRRAEFSLYIDPKKQNQGYGKKALCTLLDHGFYHFGLNGIWGESFAGNPAIKMFERLGFKKEGERRNFYWKEGRYIDAHLYSILWHEWTDRVHSRRLGSGSIPTFSAGLQGSDYSSNDVNYCYR